MTAVRGRVALAIVALFALALLAGVVVAAGRGGAPARQTPAPAPRVAPVVAAPAAPSDLQKQFVRVVRTVSPQVVQIQTPVGLGSGVVFDARGDVVTNAHVVGRYRRFSVTLADGATHQATLVGSDRGHDLAVVRLAGVTPPPASFGDSRRLQVGDLVLAIGNPLGLRSSVTEGIVSSLGRRVTEGDGVTLATAIQTSAPINPGNSGGALVDMTGRVVGIPTLTALDPEIADGQASGIGFAIPSSLVRRVATRLIAGA
jgi:S1-C subfamily serine protease